jgi:hypothetical protein
VTSSRGDRLQIENGRREVLRHHGGIRLSPSYRRLGSLLAARSAMNGASRLQPNQRLHLTRARFVVMALDCLPVVRSERAGAPGETQSR